MFFVYEMTDTVRILPWLFNVDLHDAISVELNKKLANKVFYNIGLCICLYDIIDVKESYIFPGDGATHTKVTMGFFDDIVIPPENLQLPSKFNETEQVWVWEYETGEGETAELFMDVGEKIRFRVVSEKFVDTTPSSAPSGNSAVAETSNEDVKCKIPYSIEASISDSGLGLLSWWS